MTRLIFVSMIVAVSVSMHGSDARAQSVGYAFGYQGRLVQGGQPASGTFSLNFTLFDSFTGGTSLGTNSMPSVSVSDGVFAVQLDFGAQAFNGDARWLEVSVNGNAMAPRQPVRAAPYALALPGMRTFQNATSPNLVGGVGGNSVFAGVVGATIGGGGISIFANRVTDNYAFIGGGVGNVAGDSVGLTSSASSAAVVGGEGNEATGIQSFIGCGLDNLASGSRSTVAGGWNNSAAGAESFVGGGVSNSASNTDCSVAGGSGNAATGFGSCVGGGNENWASGGRATIAGGWLNTAGGLTATVPGGLGNEALGDFTFAAGRRAKAGFAGSFVWADATDADFYAAGANGFNVRCTGGARFLTNSALTSGVFLAAGGNAWNIVSDRNCKHHVQSVDVRDVVERLAQVPITTWSYKSQPDDVRHIGPMAQDFHASFGVGENDTTISTIDADGVALAAIQGLYHLLQAQNAEIESQRSMLSEQSQRIAALEAIVRQHLPDNGR